MKHVCTKLACAGLFASVLALVGTTASAKDNLVTAFQGSVGSKITACQIEQVAAGIGEITGLKPEIHAGGSAFASPKKLYPQLARGITDLSMMPLSYTPGKFPLTETAHLPFLSSDNLVFAAAINNLIDDYLIDEFKGTHPLVLMALPAYQIHMSSEVADISTDLEGKRIRVSGSSLSDFFRRLGADVVGMPITQVYENMQKGVMDGFVLPNAPLLIFKQHEVSDYHLQANISIPLVYIGLSKKFWDELPSDQQAAIDAAFSGPEAAVKYSSCYNAVNDAALGLAARGDGVIRELTETELAALKLHGDAITEEYLAEVEGDGVPARAFLEALLTEIASTKAAE